MHKVSFGLVVTVSLWISGVASAAELYVSPTGSDSAVGTERAPFRTITRARDAARQLRKPVTVYLRGGNYALSEPVVFGNIQKSSLPRAWESRPETSVHDSPAKHSGGIRGMEKRTLRDNY